MKHIVATTLLFASAVGFSVLSAAETAQSLLAEARMHEAMIANFQDNAVAGSGKFASITLDHCKRLAKSYREAAARMNPTPAEPAVRLSDAKLQPAQNSDQGDSLLSEARGHEAMMAAFQDNAVASSSKFADITMGHCKRLAKSYREAAARNNPTPAVRLSVAKLQPAQDSDQGDGRLAEARKHEAMAASFQNNAMAGSSKFAQITVGHCERLAKAYRTAGARTAASSHCCPGGAQTPVEQQP